MRLSDKRAKKAFFVFFGCFCPYVRQSHDHIGWATLMGFTSINHNYPIFEILIFGDFEKRPFWFFFSSRRIFFCFILMKISPNLYGRLDGSKFWRFPWFPAIFLLCVIKRYTVYIPEKVSLQKRFWTMMLAFLSVLESLTSVLDGIYVLVV